MVLRLHTWQNLRRRCRSQDAKLDIYLNDEKYATCMTFFFPFFFNTDVIIGWVRGPVGNDGSALAGMAAVDGGRDDGDPLAAELG